MSSSARSSWASESDFDPEIARPLSSHSQIHSRPYSPSASESSSAVGGRGVPGSARWLKERSEALEVERLALVKQTLEVQGFVDSVKQKVRTAVDISDSLEMTTGEDDSTWAEESAQMLEEKQELVSRLIVHSQQGWQLFYFSFNCRRICSTFSDVITCNMLTFSDI
jgi:hypothetical protein